MLLSELTEALADYLNSSPEKWAGDMPVVAKAELDPYAMLMRDLGVYITPQFINYNIEVAKPRGRTQLTNDLLYISLIVAKVFEEIPEGEGVTNWSEAKVIVDIRERAERQIIQFTHPDVNLANVDPQPMQELELAQRNFVTMTTFGFSQVSCGTSHELTSLSTGSEENIGRAQIGAFTRFRPSSG